MSRNYVFVQRGIRTVKLRQMTVCVSLRVDSSVIEIGDVNTTDCCLNLAEMKGYQV